MLHTVTDAARRAAGRKFQPTVLEAAKSLVFLVITTSLGHRFIKINNTTIMAKPTDR